MQYYELWVYEVVFHTCKMYSIYSDYKILTVFPFCTEYPCTLFYNE